MKYFKLLALICLVFNSCIFKVNKDNRNSNLYEKLNFKNKSEIPFISECKENHSEACLKDYINELILNEAKNRNLNLLQDTLNIGIRINVDGTTSILEIKSNNHYLEQVTFDVLSKIKIIEPAYIEDLERYESTAFFWYFFVQKNELILSQNNN